MVNAAKLLNNVSQGRKLDFLLNISDYLFEKKRKKFQTFIHTSHIISERETIRNIQFHSSSLIFFYHSIDKFFPIKDFQLKSSYFNYHSRKTSKSSFKDAKIPLISSPFFLQPLCFFCNRNLNLPLPFLHPQLGGRGNVTFRGVVVAFDSK